MKKTGIIIFMLCMSMTFLVGCGDETDQSEVDAVDVNTIQEEIADEVDAIASEAEVETVASTDEVDTSTSENETLESEADDSSSDDLGEEIEFNQLMLDSEIEGKILETSDDGLIVQPTVEGGGSNGDPVTVIFLEECTFHAVVYDDGKVYLGNKTKEDMVEEKFLFLQGEYLETGEFNATKVILTN